MKPFFDAYIGPFKDKHWYWVGILLLLRVVVLLIFALVQDPNISLIAVNIAALILLSRTVIGDVYKKRYLSIWENSFFINLIILINNTIHSSNWRKSGRSCAHSSWHNLCPIYCNCVLPYSNEERAEASHAMMVCKTQVKQNT